MVILRTRNKITDFLMILAWASPFNVSILPSVVLNVLFWIFHKQQVGLSIRRISASPSLKIQTLTQVQEHFGRGQYLHWCPVISDLNYFGLVISDANRWFRTVISDGVWWFRTVISDGVRWIRTPRWIRTMISDGVRWIRTPNSVVFYITILVLISLISDGNFGRWFRTVLSDGEMYKKH